MISRTRRASYGWARVSEGEKHALIEHILDGTATAAPTHLDVYVTDRCNVDCYFCSQLDVRTTKELPVPKIVALLESLAPPGLKTVRLGGGGDPLAHRQVAAVLDAIRATPVQLENVTTNGVGLTEAVAERLVAMRCDDVLISLNAANASDYARMMQVRPALFQTVTTNVRRLKEIRERAGAEAPVIVVQFLVDRDNCQRLEEMYDLGLSLDADLIALNLVRATPHTPEQLLIAENEFPLFESQLTALLDRDRAGQRLLVCFPYDRWNGWLAAATAVRRMPNLGRVATAPSYSESIGRCFFGWYSAVVTGTGDVYPCCFLIQPGYTPLGNIHESDFDQIWRGPEFERLRYEMRETFLTDGRIRPGHLQKLRPPCAAEHQCWLKSFTFRHDEAFYAALKVAVERKRRRATSWLGGPRAILRKAQVRAFEDPRFATVWDRLRGMLRRR